MNKKSQKNDVLKNIDTNSFLILLVTIFFALTSVGVITAVTVFLRNFALDIAKNETRIILDRNLAIHTYFSHDLKPAIFELTDEFVDEDYFDPVWMSSTYAVRMIDDYYQQLSYLDYSYKEAAIDARSPQNEANEYEKEFIEQLNQDLSLEAQSEIRDIEGDPYFVTIQRGEVMEESCLKCHSFPDAAPEGLIDKYGPYTSFGREPGEVISAISIAIPLDETYQKINDLNWTVAGIVVFAMAILFILINWVKVQLIMNPLKKISNQAELITENRKYLGSQIDSPGFKEVQEFVKAFNEMSESLRQERDELEKRVQERTIALNEAKEQMEFMAKHDALTKLPNRWLFDEKTKQTLRLARRTKKSCAILMIDIDDFKKINDRYGHLIGDQVIKEAGQRFTNILRESDLVSRWGGDEFAILLYDVEKTDDVIMVIKKMFSAFEEPVSIDGKTLNVLLSVGVAKYPQDGEDLISLLKHADSALYVAKEQRTDHSYSFFDENF
jgi:diguanylate cyclase (GGDEF)-like protein